MSKTIKPAYARRIERENGGLLEVELTEIPPDMALKFSLLERVATLGRVPVVVGRNEFSGRYMVALALEDLQNLIDPAPTPSLIDEVDAWLAVCAPDQLEGA